MCERKVFSVTALFLLSTFQTTESAWLRCFRGSMDDYIATPLSNPYPLLQSPCIDPSLRTLIHTFGYRGRTNGPATTAIMSTYIATKKKNVILLDWEHEAKSGILGIPMGYFLYAMPNAKKIGQELGEALLKLASMGLNMSDVHLMGHSLGAHVMAHAGRWIREKGQVVTRITGLDPARALFEGSFTLQNGLDRSCAKFVDIIHSDPGNYGTSKPTGTVDFWPNYAPNSVQPGCPPGKFDAFTQEDLCSHDRSWRYLVESVQRATSFPAVAAENYEHWMQTGGYTNLTIFLGDLAYTRARGNFFLTTNSRPPYAKGLEGMSPISNETRRRRYLRNMRYLRSFRLLR